VSAPRLDPAAYRLMLVTDRGMIGARSLDDVVAAAVAGGVTSVQLREKDTPTRAFVDLARALDRRLAPLGVPLFVNDRVDVALAAGIRNVHVGQSDMHPDDVRTLLGPDGVIGLSITALDEMRAADLAAVDYVGVGPIHPTGSKADASPSIGLAGLGAIRAVTDLPIVAIGGIGVGEAAAVVVAGADGIAVVSAIMAVPDPRAAASALRVALAR
jgi:thiamine-phosphate pyrophosphorylase